MKHNKGMTLIEVVTAMGLTLLLIALVMTIIITSMRTVGDTVAFNEGNNIAVSVYDLLENSLRDATAISDSDPAVSSDGRFFSVGGDGYLLFEGVEVYDRTLYRGGHLSYWLDINHNVVDMTVTVNDYSVSGSFRLINETAFTSATLQYTYGSDSAAAIYYAKQDENALMSMQSTVDYSDSGNHGAFDSSPSPVSGWTADSGEPGGGAVLDSTANPNP